MQVNKETLQKVTEKTKRKLHFVLIVAANEGNEEETGNKTSEYFEAIFKTICIVGILNVRKEKSLTETSIKKSRSFINSSLSH